MTVRTTGAIYAEYDRLIGQVEAWVAASAPRIAGCADADVRARLVQRIVQLTADHFSDQAIQGQPLGHVFSGGGLRIDCRTGRVSASWRMWAIGAIYFAGEWLEVLKGFVRAARVAVRPASIPATVLMEAGGGYEQDDSRFIEFCRSGPIEPLRQATRIVVQAPRPPAHPAASRVEYAPRALAHVVGTLGDRDRRQAFWRHLSAPFRFVAAIARCRLAVLVGRDLALVPVVRQLDASGLLENVVISTSAFPAQPLWMKGLRDQRFGLHMVWYSQNFIPKMYMGETERSNLPAARHMRVDVHWVWTEGFRDYLRSLGSTARVELVGPILWYLPDAVHPIALAGGLRIAVFDITPLPDGQTAFGALKNYYSVTTISRFITDVVEVSEALAAERGGGLEILIKHKRAPKTGYHDSSYLDMLEGLARRKPHVVLIDHHTNLFSLLGACDVSISVPWTSTAYVGAHLGKPGIYYDPFAELVATHEPSPFVHFAAGRVELLRTMRECLAPASVSH